MIRIAYQGVEGVADTTEWSGHDPDSVIPD
jgi:hypothetical protein